MKILIAVPCMDQVPVRFCQSLAMMQKVGDCVLAMQMGSLIYTSRNSLATKALQSEADYVFWLDSDMVFEPDTLIRMMDTLQKNDLDILTGLYFRRVPPYTPVLFSKLDKRTETIFDWAEPKELPDHLFEVEGCGFGCVMMKTEVIAAVRDKYSDLFGHLPGYGEDLSFCIRARGCGYRIWADPKVQVGHKSSIIVDDSVFQAFRKKLPGIDLR